MREFLDEYLPNPRPFQNLYPASSQCHRCHPPAAVCHPPLGLLVWITACNRKVGEKNWHSTAGRRNFSAQFITILRVCKRVKKMETVALSIKSDPANGAYHARYVTRHTPALGVWLPPFILLHFPSEDENAQHVCLSLFQWLFLPF